MTRLAMYRWIVWCRVALRLVLAGVFLVAVGSKCWAWAEFVERVGDFGIVPDAAVPFAALGICGLELVLAVALLANTAWASAASGVLLLSFLAILGYGISIGMDGECGCLGKTVRLSLQQQFVVDVALLAMACTETILSNLSNRQLHRTLVDSDRTLDTGIERK